MQTNLYWQQITGYLGREGRSKERWEGGVTKGITRKLWGVMDMFIIFIVVMVLWVYMYVKTYKIVYFKYCSLIYVKCTSMKEFKVTLKAHILTRMGCSILTDGIPNNLWF